MHAREPDIIQALWIFNDAINAGEVLHLVQSMRRRSRSVQDTGLEQVDSISSSSSRNNLRYDNRRS